MSAHKLAKFIDLDLHTLHDVFRLRTDVFVVEQQCAYPELDGRDIEPATLHAWVRHDGKVASYLRVTAETDGHRIGRVCTDPAARGRGLAGELMTAALDHLGEVPVWLHAQVTVVPFYERFGFLRQGEQFEEDGIAHVVMTRNVTSFSGQRT